MAQVIGALGLKVGGSVYPMLRKRIVELGLDTSHWTGQGWAKGRKLAAGPAESARGRAASRSGWDSAFRCSWTM